MSATGFLSSHLVAGMLGVFPSRRVAGDCAPSAASPAAGGHPASGGPGTRTHRAAGSPYRLSGDPDYLQRIHTGSRPCGTLGAAGAVWVADITDNRVTRLDPATGKPTAEVTVGAGPCGMAYGARSIWVENYTANTVTRILLPSLSTRSYPVGNQPYDVTFAASAAWVTNYGDGTVTSIDATTGRTRTVKVGLNPVGIARAAGAVWVANSSSGTISRIDGQTLAVRQVRCGGSPAWTAYDAGTVWVGDTAAGQVLRLDATTGRVVARVKVGPTPNDGDVFGGSVWFPDNNGGLYRIDEKTLAVSGPFSLHAQNPFVVSGYDGRLWVADFGGTDTIEVDPADLPGG